MADFLVCQFCGRTPFEYPGPPQPTCCEEMLEYWQEERSMPHMTVEMPRWQFVTALVGANLIGLIIGHWF